MWKNQEEGAIVCMYARSAKLAYIQEGDLTVLGDT
jgi:hypothetical protein